MRIVLPFLLILAIKSGVAYAQAVSDSLMIQEIRAAFKLTSTAPDSARAIAEKGIQQSRYSSNKRLAAYAYKTKGWAWLRLGNYDSCFADLLLSTDLFHQLNDSTETMYMYLNLANAYSARSEFSNSASYLIRADSIAQAIDNLTIQAGVKRQMGILYRQQGEHKKAIGYFKESMAMCQKARDSLHFLDAANSLSIVYNLMSLPDSSLRVLKECEPIVNAMRNPGYLRATLSEQFGDSYFALASYAKALENYKIAYSIFALDNNRADMAFEAINLGKTYVRMKSYGEAEKYLLQSYRINDSLHMIHYTHDAARELSALYKIRHDYEKAFQWLEITSTLNDSLQLIQQNEKTADVQAKYETEKKDKEISLLKKDQELSGIVLQRQKTFRYGAVIVLALLALIAFLIINRYRLINKSKRHVEMEKLRNDIARDLHDDMGSALSSINIISKVALDSSGEKDNIQEHLKKIQDNSGYMLESMSDAVWAINPANDTFEKILFKMKEFAADILEPLDIEYTFSESGSHDSIHLGLKERKNIYLIFKEAINNAAKYSACTAVNANFMNREDGMEMKIADNGIGFDIDIAENGNGLRNMKQRAAEIDGRLDIFSEKGNGTSITLSIKSHV